MSSSRVINTRRAMRRLKRDPVPDEPIWKVLDAAVKARSGGSRQPHTGGEVVFWEKWAWPASADG